MALNSQVSFTWVGHGTWMARSAKGKQIIIDPWVMNNPAAPEALKKVESCDLMLITHGRQICKAQRPRCPECPVARMCDYAAAIKTAALVADAGGFGDDADSGEARP